MCIPRRSLVARVRARLRRALAPPVIALIYHRVLPERGRDLNGLAVERGHFADQLRWLTRHCRCLTPAQLMNYLPGGGAAGWQLGDMRPRVFITFDDGYADNVIHALPELTCFGVPAMLFVASDLVGQPQPFWWDTLEHLVCAGKPPQDTWRLADGTTVSLEQGVDRAYRALHDRLKPLAAEPRQMALAALALQGGIEPPADGSHRTASWDELRSWLAADMSIGAHTCTHPQLSALADIELQAEIVRGKRELEARLGIQANSFSYPYGTQAEVDPRSQTCVRQAGFRYAFVNRPGNLRRARNVFALPRYLVRDWPVAEFARHFAEWCA